MDVMLSAQVAVLGAVMLRPEELAGQVVRQLRLEDFTDNTCRAIYGAIRGLYLARRPVDPVLIVETLGKSYASAVSEILAGATSTAPWQAYCKQLRDNRQLREIQSAVMSIISAGTTLGEARQLLAQASKLLLQDDSVREASYATLMADFVERQLDPSPPDYLDLGMDPLTRRVRIGPRRFVVIGAESSVGKTAFALQLARSIAKSGKRVGFYSYETSREDLGDRIAANVLTVPLSSAKDKSVPQEVLHRASAEAEANLPLKIMETARWTIDDLRVKILSEGFDVVFIDYLQLIPVPQRERWQAVTQISMDLHALAQETGTVIFGLSQVTPPPVDKKGWRPWISKHNLRESQQLSHDADVILLLDLCDIKDRASDRVLIIDKNKDGGLGRVVLRFEPDYMRFTAITPPEDHPYYRVMAYIRGVNRERKAEAQAAAGASPPEEPQQVSWEEYTGEAPF